MSNNDVNELPNQENEIVFEEFKSLPFWLCFLGILLHPVIFVGVFTLVNKVVYYVLHG